MEWSRFYQKNQGVKFRKILGRSGHVRSVGSCAPVSDFKGANSILCPIFELYGDECESSLGCYCTETLGSNPRTAKVSEGAGQWHRCAKRGRAMGAARVQRSKIGVGPGRGPPGGSAAENHQKIPYLKGQNSARFLNFMFSAFPRFRDRNRGGWAPLALQTRTSA